MSSGKKAAVKRVHQYSYKHEIPSSAVNKCKCTCHSNLRKSIYFKDRCEIMCTKHTDA